MHSTVLDLQTAKWQWRQSPCSPLTPAEEVLAQDSLNDGFQACTQMPSQIHVEMLATGQIPDPFKRCNEETVQWVGETDWIYRCTFDCKLHDGETRELHFDGLDTFATVYLNGRKVLTSDNMFLPSVVDVSDAVKDGENQLYIVFASAFIQGRLLEEEHLGKDRHLTLWNGDASRLFVRKAQYNYGWDWGPVLMTAGPWRAIRLEAFTARIRDIHPVATVSEKLDATLSVEIETTHDLPTTITLLDPAGQVMRKFTHEELRTEPLHFAPDEIELWWSVGLGKQPLYTIKVDLVDSNGKVVDTLSKRFGFRRLRVVQHELDGQPGTSFFFEINRVPIFAGGSNWIPIDSFATNSTRGRYKRWLELLVNGNQNMIRVWAGGYYEPDEFYEICDELGILVWQDFMFGCGQYPAHKELLESVRLEAAANVKRIRSHPCLAIFAGNNEDYQVAEQAHLEYDPDDVDGDWSKTTFPAREIYERVLPAVVHKLSDVYYHPGSPWGGKDTTDKTVGDIHQWNVWHGSQQRYQDWDKLGGRFVSEFGMQGLPDIRTIDYFLDGDSSERFPQSKTMANHNKADGYERRLELYLVENIRHGFKMEDYVYATQLIQAETLSTAYQLWRREFRGPGKEYTAGALVWQLNDVWPCTSWSIADYFCRPKPAYYSIKQSMAPIAVGMKRFVDRSYPDPHKVSVFKDRAYVEIWACNSLVHDRKVVLVTEAFELVSGERIYHTKEDAILAANQSTELGQVDVPVYDKEPSAVVVVSVKLVDSETDETLSRFLTFPEPYKFLHFPDEAAVELNVRVDVDQGQIKISAARPVKGLVLSLSDDVILSDNALDLIPGDERVVTVKGLKQTTDVTWRYLGDKYVP